MANTQYFSHGEAPRTSTSCQENPSHGYVTCMRWCPSRIVHLFKFKDRFMIPSFGLTLGLRRMIIGGVAIVCMRSPRLENGGKTMVACDQYSLDV